MDFGAQYVNGFMNGYQQNQYGNAYNNLLRRSLPKYNIIKVSGRQGANTFEMGPDSSIFLADEKEDIIWFVKTDGAGYKTVTPLDVSPHIDKPPVDINVLNDKILRIEELVSTIMEEIKNGRVSIGVNESNDSESK